MSESRFFRLLSYHRIGLLGVFLLLWPLLLGAEGRDGPSWPVLLLAAFTLMAGSTGVWIIAAYRRVWPWALLGIFVLCYGTALFNLLDVGPHVDFYLRLVGLGALGILMFGIQFMGPEDREAVSLRRPSPYR